MTFIQRCLAGLRRHLTSQYRESGRCLLGSPADQVASSYALRPEVYAMSISASPPIASARCGRLAGTARTSPSSRMNSSDPTTWDRRPYRGYFTTADDMCLVAAMNEGSFPTKLALRVLAGSDGGEEVPVGSAGVEQLSDPVVGEVGDPKNATRFTGLKLSCQAGVLLVSRSMVRVDDVGEVRGEP